MKPKLSDDYRSCKQISHSSNSSFPKAFWLLPKRQRNALYAIYAYFRLLDDIVDSNQDPIQKEQQLTELVDLFQNRNTGDVHHPVIRALNHTIQTFSLDLTPFQNMVEGLRMDLHAVPILNETDLFRYCDCVAGTVGLLLIQIAGVPVSVGQDYALFTGRALQMTNILRDLRTDVSQNRLYIPETMLKKHNVQKEMFIETPYPPAVKQLLSEFGELTQSFFERSKEAKPTKYTYELRFTETLRWMYNELFRALVQAEFETSQLKKKNKIALYFQLLKHYSVV